MERIVLAANMGMPVDQAIAEVGDTAFGDVIHRFHNLSGDDSFKGKFYRYEFGKYLELTDDLYAVSEGKRDFLDGELDARWSLLEGAFSIDSENFNLANDIRSIYLENGVKRKDLTKNVPFLQGYQGNVCFYCGEPIVDGDVHVDHVLPRQVVMHDEIWNLVLAHKFCNDQKSDRLVGECFTNKLAARNENIIGSNHPWKKKIISILGETPNARVSKLQWHYDNVSVVIGRNNYWGGSESYNPKTDPFFRKLITVLNNERNRG